MGVSSKEFEVALGKTLADKTILPPFRARMRALLGKKVAVRCGCYLGTYICRGILSAVGDDAITLTKATTIEVSGPDRSERPQAETEIGISLTIERNAIITVWQPLWSQSPLPGENG